jgi:hypothetical protein
LNQSSATGGTYLTPVNVPPTTLPAPGAIPASGEASTPSSSGDFMSGIGNFFSNIPPTMLYIGGAVLLFMMFKKR